MRPQVRPFILFTFGAAIQAASFHANLIKTEQPPSGMRESYATGPDGNLVALSYNSCPPKKPCPPFTLRIPASRNRMHRSVSSK